MSRVCALFVCLGFLTCLSFATLADDDQHSPANAVANLVVHPQLQATLFASEPVLTNPTNLDVDARGRVWVCDVVNYRGNNGKRPEGDRILILEDTDGDGKADRVKTFYQDRDVDSAMGICVLGNKVIVSCSPNVWVFTFDEDDKILKKEALFTKTGQPQHDHSAHSFVFGPDGKLYWNFGNTGHAVRDKDGKQVIDQAGNAVIDNGKPYFGGMVFRCNMDGSGFETLAHNFRNNYEVAVDSFGTMWQSDNDDDGNRGVRINYVMEFGNFGYRDELTGAGWQAKRTNTETDVPLRHWHQNDPSVVPNLLQTGAGSPCGICVNEGDLLPAVFKNQMIHCDAGPSVVRAYPVRNDGAGYKAEIVNILDGSKKNNWFRPADVCVAPDGSLFVTDWYDPGVGGHAQRDIKRGRIFRVAPPKMPYRVPKFDFDTAEGAVEALKSPNLAVRYIAWTKLHELRAKAEPALLKLWQSDNARYRARALWLLGRIEGNGQKYVDLALKDQDSDLRIVGIRLTRQLRLDLEERLQPLLLDPSPQVRREYAIALRFCKEASCEWALLAYQHKDYDRWYLEALGIGADLNWGARLPTWDAFAFLFKPSYSPAARDIIFRSRAIGTPERLAGIIHDSQVSTAELPGYFRAFDFQKTDDKDAILARLATDNSATGARRALIITEAVTRLKGLDLSTNPRLAAAVAEALEAQRGTAAFVELVSRFSVAARYPDLLALAQQNPGDQISINAVRALLDKGQSALVENGLRDANAERATNTAKALGTAGDSRAVGLLEPLLMDTSRPPEVRRQAVRSLARTKSGAQVILKMARGKRLPGELKAVAGAALQMSPYRGVHREIAELFPVPPAKDNKPLPPINELVTRTGDASKGKVVYEQAGTCANCHKVNGAGKEVGPDLSEIGGKLSREALFESILFPSAGISHNYEMYSVETKNGTTMNGVLVSQTPEEITLKGADALVRTFKRADIDVSEKSSVSLMPADLHKVLTDQDLVDLVEYMLALKKNKATDQHR